MATMSTPITEAKCTVCGKGFNYYDLFCMKSGRGANSNCADHTDFLICQKCGGFKNGLVPQPCPYCGAMERNGPIRTKIDGKWYVYRHCQECLNRFAPDGAKLQ